MPTLHLTRLALSGAVIAVTLILCVVTGIAVSINDPKAADPILYLAYTLAGWMCVAACVPYIRRETGVVRLRWSLFALSLLLKSLVLLSSFFDENGLIDVGYARIVTSCFSSLAEALLLIAIASFFSRISRPILWLDAFQISLFYVLRFAQIYGPKEADLFQKQHLAVSTASCAFYCLIALGSLPSSNSREEKRFLRLAAIGLALDFAWTLLANQIGYQWLHYLYASPADVAGIPLATGFALVAIQSLGRPAPELGRNERSVLMRNLMPSFLTLANLALGMTATLYYPVAGSAAILFVVLCFVLRTALLQGEVSRERDRLDEVNRQLNDLVARDPLTGIGNRRSLVSALAQLQASQVSEEFSLVLVDADWFKLANDHHGHLHGDQVLMAIANVLRDASAAIPRGHCARLGGDEFAVLLPSLGRETARQFAEEIRLRIDELALQAGDRTISISVGATISTVAAGLTFERLMGRADEALYRAKSLGRNRVEVLA